MARKGLRLLFFLAATFVFPATALSTTPAYKNAIASAHPLATEAGMRVLHDGGNAFDAAITVAAVLAVVEPYSSGLGGGGFWLLYRASDGRQIMLDGRERAPLAAHRDMYLDDQGNVIAGASMNGALAAGIPGQVAAMVHLQRHYGSLSLSRLLQPAIKLAQEGFVVGETYHRLVKFRLSALRQSAVASSIFLLDSDQLPSDHLLRQPDLANTLQLIADRGRDGFYAGEVAENLVKGVQAAGGLWSLQDLKEYRVVERQPVQWQWLDMMITSAALPSSGGIVMAQILSMLTQFDWQGMNADQRRHLLIETMRRAYRDRAEYLGDSDYIAVDVARLTSQKYARQLAEDIDLEQATSSDSLREVVVKTAEGNDTTHYSILDTQGNRVSATLSINYPFGSAFVAPGTGVLLNDEMDDFSIRPGVPNAYGLVGAEANAVASGKRMLSSMSPTFIENDNRLAIVGTPGGSRIITMVLQAILALHEGKTAEEIVVQPRLHHQYLPDVVQLEPATLNAQQQSQLERLGHKLRILNNTFGNMQLVLYDKHSGQTTAASDPRGVGRSSVD